MYTSFFLSIVVWLNFLSRIRSKLYIRIIYAASLNLFDKDKNKKILKLVNNIIRVRNHEIIQFGNVAWFKRVFIKYISGANGL